MTMTLEIPQLETTQADANPLETARRIGPLIAAYGEEAEQQGRLSQPVLDALLNTGLLTMLTPKSLGGLEVDPLTYASVVEEIAGQDSAAGWTLCNPIVFAFYVSKMPDSAAEEIFADGPNTVLAAGIYPPMQAVPTDGGFRISGQVPFVSNSHDANWLVAHATVMDGEQPRLRENGTPMMLRVILPMDRCRILDNWSVMGMRGTGSNDVSVDSVFVPQRRAIDFVPGLAAGSYYQSPLYRFPPVGVVACGIPSVMLAIARKAIDEVIQLAQEKKPLQSAKMLRERSATQFKVAQAEAAVRSARAFLHSTIGEVWETVRAGGEALLEQKADLLLASTNAVSSAVAAVEMMQGIAGTSGIFTGSPLERHFRDVQVLKHHGVVSESRFESVGQVYLGLPTDFPMLHF